MNEQIQKLYKQAAEYAQQQEPTDLIAAQVVWHTKFAELIVRECSEVCRQQQYYDADDEHKRGVNGGSITCMNAIKRHFGVEE